MNFDTTITLGNLITIGSLLFGLIGAGYSIYFRLNGMQGSLSKIDKRIDGVDDELKKQTEILIELASQRARMNALERRMDEIASRKS